MELSAAGADWLTGGGLVLVGALRAQGSIVKPENWGYANPNSDVLESAVKASRWGGLAFGLGIIAQLVALILGP